MIKTAYQLEVEAEANRRFWAEIEGWFNDHPAPNYHRNPMPCQPTNTTTGDIWDAVDFVTSTYF